MSSGVMAQLACFLTQSVMGRKMLCFTVETAAVVREGRICETAVAGYVRAMFAPCSRYVRATFVW